jgi:hypothetical protein
MTTEQRETVACDGCGVTFYADTMFSLDTSPECGECQDIRFAVEIRLHWIAPAEPSEVAA